MRQSDLAAEIHLGWFGRVGTGATCVFTAVPQPSIVPGNGSGDAESGHPHAHCDFSPRRTLHYQKNIPFHRLNNKPA